MTNLVSILILIAVALLAGWLGTKIGLSRVIGQLMAGLIVGPALLGWVEPSHLIDILAEAGVLLLLFNAGLETDIKALKKNAKPATYVAVMGVIVPLIAFPLAALAFGIAFDIAIFWGIVFAATSISITIAVLAEQNKIQTRVGAVVLGAAVLDDILALLLVTVYTMFIGSQGLSLTTLFPLIAFGLGLLVSRWSKAHDLHKGLSVLGDWTLFPIFFGSIGLAVHLTISMQEMFMLVILTALAIATKYYGSGFGARFAGMDAVEGRAIGAGMVSRGEMALVIAKIGAGAGVLAPEQFAQFVIVIILSTIAAPIMLKPMLAKVN